MDAVTLSAPYQTAFTILSNCSDLLDSLKLKYGDYIIDGRKGAQETIVANKGNGGYTICFKGESIRTETPFAVVSDILYENTSYDSNIFALHGAALEWNRQVYLLLAATTSGKTTLASFLVSNGFGYLTDDCILLDRTNFYVHPYPTPIHLRYGGYEVLKQMGLAPESASFLDADFFKRYVYMPETAIREPLPLSKIFFIKRTEGTNATKPMQMTDKIMALLKAPIQEYEVNAEHLQFISQLAKKPCYQLFYSDMHYVAEVIQNAE